LEIVAVRVTALPYADGEPDVVTLNVGTTAFNRKLKVLETALEIAVSFAFCAAATGDPVAVNSALVAFAGTFTVAGSFTAVLLLDRLTTSPPADAFELSLTSQ
jgi:hypothetical protein